MLQCKIFHSINISFLDFFVVAYFPAENTDCQLTSRNDNKLSKTFNDEMESFDVKKSSFPTFDYAKASSDDLALEEMKTLKATPATDLKLNDDDDEDDEVDAHEQRQPRQQPEQSTTVATKDDVVTFDTAKFVKASFFMQYLLLLNRIFICARRSSVSTKIYV